MEATRLESGARADAPLTAELFLLEVFPKLPQAAPPQSPQEQKLRKMETIARPPQCRSP